MKMSSAWCRSAQQAATPDMPYAELLTRVHARLAGAWDVADDPAEDARFGASVGDWPAFPDTVAALRMLQQSYRLVILSNVDRHSFHATQRRLGVPFDAIYTAQDVGSYKPDPRNFAYLIDRLADDGFQKSDVLHVAQSLFHDHAPANAVGLASAWIDRRYTQRAECDGTSAGRRAIRFPFQIVWRNLPDRSVAIPAPRGCASGQRRQTSTARTDRSA